MPIGILGSLVICTVLYIAVSAVLTGMVPLRRSSNVNAPVADAFAHDRRAAAGSASSSTSARCSGITSVILVMLLGQPRVFYSMSRDGLLPASFGAAVHPKFRTPYRRRSSPGIAVGLATGVLPLSVLGQLVNIGTLLAFVIVCAGVLDPARDAARLPSGRSGRRWCPSCRSSGILCCLGLMCAAGRYLAAADRLAR